MVGPLSSSDAKLTLDVSGKDKGGNLLIDTSSTKLTAVVYDRTGTGTALATLVLDYANGNAMTFKVHENHASDWASVGGGEGTSTASLTIEDRGLEQDLSAAMVDSSKLVDTASTYRTTMYTLKGWSGVKTTAVADVKLPADSTKTIEEIIYQIGDDNGTTAATGTTAPIINIYAIYEQRAYEVWVGDGTTWGQTDYEVKHGSPLATVAKATFTETKVATGHFGLLQIVPQVSDKSYNYKLTYYLELCSLARTRATA